MIGLRYKGQIFYINKLEDFRDVMEPEVYEALETAINRGFDYNLKDNYESLKVNYEILENDFHELQGVEDDLYYAEQKCDELETKYEGVKTEITRIINDVYQGYISRGNLLFELERIKSSFDE